MKINYCLPIIKSKTGQVLEMISKNQDYDFFEIWLDYIQDLDLNFILDLKNRYGKKIIFLFRRQNLEKPKMGFEKRKKIMDIISPSCFLDLDISQKQDLKYLKNNSKKINLILSYHNYQETPSDQKLQEIIKKMVKQNADIYKITTFCNSQADAIRLVDLLSTLKEQKIKCIILGMGEKGVITRIAGVLLGNEINYAPTNTDNSSAVGQLTKDELEKILKNIKICYFVADPVEHSLSPQMHYAGYKALGINHDFIFLRRRVKPKGLKKFVEEIKKDPNFKGACISIPHKIEIMKYLDEIDAVAKKIGAVNTVVNKNGRLTGYNTDWLGAITALEEKTNIKNKSVAVIGAGGAARAIVYGLIKKGAKVKIFNRSLLHAKKLAKDFGCEYGRLNSPEEISKMDTIINATPVGMNEDRSPVDKKLINKNHIVFDAVYAPHQTRLIKDAKQKKVQVILGTEMLLYQGTAQFELFTNRKAPVEAMRKALT
ncbi:TPA: shikimate dehydrogenase [Candidatus Daviesbacteria bacterium]|nr:MAG: shikimate dehydrogenase [Candidatus Daviesbacteria bacterium RIFCSPHIGHO2_02_FULL_39_41]OGE28526.1 MAG: shikimate dehydrogenase [Candidatus Daviesbacteria bacterium RIFCSPHIGHO2_01_FULL_38_8b]OGE44538.1 MAG: shikimate dehydrogenase [Candidatus Daviesbacteria bacterium RIFCSPHIGHO2_12_FULL_38_25]OGE68309.1 MAG: shikimate dehydrogenase [Candidatus Daviesbacteria bacterium RIFCSPLOWO2_02_FULL_38_18]OGE72843.1 MAG: shikimate dehydrogenase [Candidatus Daviesbacteria bacterium RIFCSPLOWO2_12_